MAQVSESSDKDFNAAIIKMLQQAIYKHARNTKKSKQRNRKCRKKNQIGTSELKNTVTQIKNSKDGFSSQ